MPKSKQAEEDIFDTPDIVMQDDDAEEEEEEEEEEELEELEQLENDISEQYKFGGNEDDEQDDDDNDDDDDDDDNDDDDDDEGDEYDEDNDDDNDDEEQEEEDDEEMVDALEEVSRPESDPKSTDSQAEDKENKENDNKTNSSKDSREQTSEVVTDSTSTVIPDSEASDEKAKVGSTEGKEAEQSSSKEEVKSQDVSVAGTDADKQDTAITKEIESSDSTEKQSQDDSKTESSSMKETDPSTSSPAATTATATDTKYQESTSTSTSVEPEPALSEPVRELPPMEQMLNHVKTLRTHASLASQYNIIPQVAIPYASAIHSVAFSQSGRYLFTGGEDGFIRKYDTFQSIDGEAQLTAAQRHSVVDSVTNGGALLSYWENEIPFKKSALGTGKKDHYDMKLSPVYSLAVQSQGMWLLSGLANGGVNLQSLRHQEGTIVHHWKQHTDIISDVLLNGDETKFITGGWDMKINQYDLNTGDVISRYEGLPGQVIGLEYRPTGVNSVNIADIAPPKVKDDDLDSLFGDDDEEEEQGEGAEEPPLKKSKGSRPTPEEPVNSTFEKDPNVFLCTGTNGIITILDHRQQTPCLSFNPPKGTAPFAMSSAWSTSGNSIFVGRRNAHVEELSLRMPFDSHTGDTLVQRNLKFPSVSGAVTTVKTMPNSQHVVCGSFDNIRIYDLNKYDTADSKTPFWIVPGHHGGVLSRIEFDPSWRYCVSASGGRGVVQGQSTEMAFIYEVECEL